jgi:ribosomal protein S25
MLFSSICAIVDAMELYMRTVSIVGTFLIPGILVNKFSDALSVALARKAVKELEESGELDEIFKNEKDTHER